MVEQLQTWYVITTKEKFAIKAHFLDPWSNRTNAHITTLACQLVRHQVKCGYHGVTVTEAEKVDHFVARMYACDLLEANFLDDWEERNDKMWGATQPHFTQQYLK